MNTSKTILVLGGGVGGLVTARSLRKHLGRQHRVVLVERERNHVFAPSLLWLMVGLRESRDIQRQLSRLAGSGIDVIHGEVERIEPEHRRVHVAGQEIDSDYLVVSLGAELAPETIPNLEAAGRNFYTLAGAESLRGELGELRSGRIVVLTAAPGYKCPAAPYEAALLIDAYFRKRGLRESVTIEVYAAEPGPMGVAGPEMSRAVKQLLVAKSISYHPEHQITEVDADGKRLKFSNGLQAGFDVLAYVPPHRAPRVVRESPIAGPTGWISVDRHTLETCFAGVYAIADVVSIPLALGKPLPKSGVFAHAEAQVVAKNIAAAVNGVAPLDRYAGRGECFIETGDGKAGYGGGDFYAEPTPNVRMRKPARYLHWGKVLFEKSWLQGWF